MKLGAHAVVLQKYIRQYQAQTRYRKFRAAAKAAEGLRLVAAATRIVAFVRGWLARRAAAAAAAAAAVVAAAAAAEVEAKAAEAKSAAMALEQTRRYVRRNSKSGHQLMQNNYGGMLSLSSG